MIKRIVKLHFQEQFTDEFLDLYKNHLNGIKNFPDCQNLEIYSTGTEKGIFITLSLWKSEEALNNYRSSQYFKDIWTSIKPWFAEKAEAWTLDKIEF